MLTRLVPRPALREPAVTAKRLIVLEETAAAVSERIELLEARQYLLESLAALH